MGAATKDSRGAKQGGNKCHAGSQITFIHLVPLKKRKTFIKNEKSLKHTLVHIWFGFISLKLDLFSSSTHRKYI